MEVRCRVCGDVLKEPGGLMFDPPINDMCIKSHFCYDCWGTVESFVRGLSAGKI
jgi:hypothetical protein